MNTQRDGRVKDNQHTMGVSSVGGEDAVITISA